MLVKFVTILHTCFIITLCLDIAKALVNPVQPLTSNLSSPKIAPKRGLNHRDNVVTYTTTSTSIMPTETATPTETPKPAAAEPFHLSWPSWMTDVLSHIYNVMALGAIIALFIMRAEKKSISISRRHFIPPSIYDIFRAAQFFITTALLSLPCLSSSYRNLAFRIGWLSGLPPSFVDSAAISKGVDKQIRGTLCNVLQNCSKDVNNGCVDNLVLHSDPRFSGFAAFGQSQNVPGYDLFFIVMIMFCAAMVIVTSIAFLLGLLARSCKFLWEKWPTLETIADHLFLFVLGKQ
ncbi:8043_t:CDS:1 [Paraglomus brasilianum]|uniref:8043_t:CDS:1 n=1 Tax=Paraglomus brasilianum TaxID=144538 RepID=A0A9N8W9T0_9GLOM|nr:8043_t:CDS:1 [Paraglomus brasilianum]